MKKYLYQQGSTLIVVLILLVLISIGGVYAIRHSMFNLKMATSAQVQTLLMQTSDVALARLEKNFNDNEANNLIILLDLNNQKRVEDRKNYVKRRRESINDRKLQTGAEIKKYFQDKIDNEINSISYLRAIQEEFKIDIWSMIPEPE